MNALLRSLPLLCLGLMSPLAQAEDPTWFEVELLVFSRPDTSTEHWSDSQAPLAPVASQDLLGPVWLPDVSSHALALNRCNTSEWLADPEGCEQREQANTPVTPSILPRVAYGEALGNPLDNQPYLLTRDMMEFEGAKRQLARKPGHNILLHTGWQMPVYGRNQARPFALYGGRDFAERYQANGLEKRTDEGFQFDLGDLMTGAQGPLWELNGWVRIYLDRFLFIETRLDLREEGLRQWEEQDEDGNELQQSEPFLYTIALEQNRRVRSREIHYFDHPKLGLVVHIRRMEQPDYEAARQAEQLQQEASAEGQSVIQ